MKPSPILSREESRPPRLLTWPLVFLGSGVVVSASGGRLFETHPGLFALYVFVGAFCTLVVLEFVAVAIEVTETEVRFCIAPFYRRRIAIANIQHWEVKTYLNAPWASNRSWQPRKHCVELTMKDRSLFTLMSQHPEKLSTAIVTAKETSAGHEVHSAHH